MCDVWDQPAMRPSAARRWQNHHGRDFARFGAENIDAAHRTPITGAWLPCWRARRQGRIRGSRSPDNWEGQAITAAARQNKRLVMVGTQHRSAPTSPRPRSLPRQLRRHPLHPGLEQRCCPNPRREYSTRCARRCGLGYVPRRLPFLQPAAARQHHQRFSTATTGTSPITATTDRQRLPDQTWTGPHGRGGRGSSASRTERHPRHSACHIQFELHPQCGAVGPTCMGEAPADLQG
jgi:hypothetical protein